MWSKSYITLKGPFALNPEREDSADFSHTVYVDDDVFMLGFKIDDDPWALLRPFELEVWVGILLIAPIYWLASGLVDLVHTGTPNWMLTADFTFRSMVSQSKDSMTMKNAKLYKRIHAIVWIWACLVFVRCYSGAPTFIGFFIRIKTNLPDNLAALLTEPSKPPLTRKIDDIVRNKNSVRFGFEKGTATEMIGKNASQGSTLR